MFTTRDGQAFSPEAVYAAPKTVTDLIDCFFYHTMEIPGHGLVKGPWDLRGDVDAYLGGVNLHGRRVLELGTASGFLCFEMERRGAKVTAYDLSEAQDWDVVPSASTENPQLVRQRKVEIRRLNNAWWLAHRANQSSARVAYGRIYDIPTALGPVDVATFGCILLHLRDPFLALAKVLRLVRDQVIITEPDWASKPGILRSGSRTGAVLRFLDRFLGGRLRRHDEYALSVPTQFFIPDYRDGKAVFDTWWHFNPPLLTQFLGLLGFQDTKLSFHEAKFDGKTTRMFTIVGRRTAPMPELPSSWN